LVSPALTMRLLAEEQSLGTIELLLTAPVRDVEVVLGKFLSSVAVFLAMLVLTLYYPLILFLFGDPDPGPIWSGYVIFLLAGGAWLSVGLLTSSFSGNQIVSWVLAAGILLGLWFIGSAGDAVGGTTGSILNYLSLSEHLRDSRFGLIDTRDIIYFVSMIVTALFLTTRSLETRRWR
ncbi:MAG: ABC transporter permease subunit, partial [Chloroflexi bacterium]|nr:ABC transporter permease subunit [Chloroflexota bacterium]